jgi:membrane-bound lytic murein transglycosylase
MTILYSLNKAGVPSFPVSQNGMYEENEVSRTAIQLFGGAIPENGYEIWNTSGEIVYFREANEATTGGTSVPIVAGGSYRTPPNYKPVGYISLIGESTNQTVVDRTW